ncbi:ABC transporter ATP-binding protein [Bogoriella caseilytica]|uniref:Peptide/nickel transport system ATP-binding protein n=1 Tax=Bogoriella caseilytica TaxID=56055 RepID=A0A3N2BBL6_9MICO|nr:ABC transporter ATP-binding protein [Bogoriella caseilytica]ROR72572.1 peptide/nickel transport system ATP-binding protein [Bogoriella caseilytica]
MTTTAPDVAAARTGAPVLEVRDLNVSFFVDNEWLPAAKDMSYEVHPGEVLAIVGESGSGKTQSSMSLLGLLPPNGRATGSAKLAGTELVGMTGRRLQRIRGADMAVIFQEPMTALNPVYTVGFQIVEQLRTHLHMTPKEAKARAIELLEMVEMPSPETRFHSYPHQLSGGQRQRAMIAMALSCDPKLLVADEPTTALDVTVQAEILKLMRDLRERVDAGIVLITHDMGVVADMADQIIVMRNGEIVERGSSQDIFANPQHPYTRQLLSSMPRLGASDGEPRRVPVTVNELGEWRPEGREESENRPALIAESLEITYPKRGRTPAFKAVDGVNLVVGRGEVVGLVGESGSGKTTIGRAAIGLVPASGGRLEIAGSNLAGIRRGDLKKLRARIGVVFQDPGSSLNPRLPLGESIGEPLFLHRGIKGRQLAQRVEELLDQVELPRSMRNRYPHELSGGQRQRVGIARALSLEPEFLVADEPTSALDVSVQARVLELFQELQREQGFACLFISHDLAVVEQLSSRVAVMQHGKIVEQGPSADIVNNPKDPYTQRLIAAVPVPDPEEQKIRRERRDALLEATAAQLAAEESARSATAPPPQEMGTPEPGRG